MRILRAHLSYANVTASLALFVALGGSAAAAKVMITSSKQIKAGAVQRSDIAHNAVDSARVANGTLTVDDFSSATKGSIQSAGTQALEAFRAAGPTGVKAGTTAVVATLANIPPGAYAIFAKTVLTGVPNDDNLSLGSSLGGHCVLDVSGDADDSRQLLGSPGSNSPGTVTNQITHTYAATGEAKVTCDVTGADWSASNASIIALRVGQSPRQVVSGR
jgi:hypothetical protein